MSHLILVPLDGSAYSAAALPAAAAIAQRRGATLHLVSVHTPAVVPLPLGGAPALDRRFDEDLRDAHSQALTRYAERLREEVGVSATWTVLKGEPAEAIVAEAQAQRAELIVLTTHGAGGFARAWLGSVADELVRLSPTPVLLVRPGGAAAGAGGAPVMPPASDADTLPVSDTTDAYEFRRVLVPLDGSALGEEILEPALELSAGDRTQYVLLRVVRVAPTAAPPEETFWTPREEEAIAAGREAAREYLDDVAERLRAGGCAVETVVVLDHEPARAILREATERGVQLIAISTSARRGFTRMRLGSVADKVVRAAPCPTLLARPRGAAEPVTR